MALSDGDIERIAQLLFEKIIAKQNQYYENEEISQEYHVYDDMGNITVVNEIQFLKYELERLNELESKYVEQEEFEKAAIIKNKINKIKLKIKKET